MIDLATLLHTAAALFDVDMHRICGRRDTKTPRMVDCRQAVALVLHDRDYTTREIGEILRRDHSTISTAISKARRRLGRDARFTELVDQLRKATLRPAPAPERTIAETVAKRRDAWTVEGSVHIALFFWGIAEPATA